MVPIPARAADCWLLTGRYVEVVWSEFLGPTATLMARRLGDFVERHPAGGEVSVTAMGVSLGAAPSMVRASLIRLDRFGITSMSVERGVVGVSGLAPSVGPRLLGRLSEAARREHRWQLDAAAPLLAVPTSGRQCRRRAAGARRGEGLRGEVAVSAFRAVPRAVGSRVGCPAPSCRAASEGGVRASCAGRFPLYTPLQVSLRETCGGPEHAGESRRGGSRRLAR